MGFAGWPVSLADSVCRRGCGRFSLDIRRLELTLRTPFAVESKVPLDSEKVREFTRVEYRSLGKDAAQRFGHWRTVREGLLATRDLLEDEQLAFTPREGLWSLGIVAVHIAEAEEGWFRHVVTWELEAWPDCAPGDSATVPAIKALLAEVHGRTQAYLETLDEADLAQVIEAPWGARLRTSWVIWYVLEHEISHRGAIYLMLGLMSMEAPDM